MAEMRCGMCNQGMNPGAGPGMGRGMNPGAGPGMGHRMSPGTELPVGRMVNPAAGQSRQALMKQINEASFAMDDVLLFLDTHPDNAEAMQYYRNAVTMRKAAMDAYQRQFGPLLVDDVMGNNWSWVTEKWPWEGGY